MSLAPQSHVPIEPTGPAPSQTIGPFFGFAMSWMGAEDLVAPGALSVRGRVIDGADEPVTDAVIEIWQADADGRLGGDGSTGWTGFGRSLTDGEGRYRFTTVAPGAVDDTQAPHIDVSIFARGLLQRLVTRLYLPGSSTLDTDPVLAGLDADRRATLVAVRESPDSVSHDIRLQGDGETVFFLW